MHQEKDYDISLKQLILNIKDYLSFFRSKWKSILISGILFMVLLGVLNLRNEKEYNAQLSFMLNVDERGLSSGVSSLLGQLGFGLSSVESNYDKIIELSKTRIIAQNALLDSVQINQRDDLLANHFITNLEEQNQWPPSSFLSLAEDSLSLENFRFTSPKADSFTTLENKALKELHTTLVGDKKKKGLFSADYDELTGIMYLTMTSNDENLSIVTVENMFKTLSDYYIEKSTEKQKYEHDIIQEKYDSINYALAGIQNRLASFEDSNIDIYRKTDLLEKNKLKIQEQKLIIMSGKSEEQLQFAKIALENKTPYIQVIDKPIAPIKASNPSLIYYLLLGGIIGAMLSLLYWGVTKTYNDILNN